jgi:hypothetical protein
MASGFSTSELLPLQSRYPVSKLGGGINAQAAALSSAANGLHETLENDLDETVGKHRQIADSHRAIAAQLPAGPAKDAHLEAAQAHVDAANEIAAIRPVEGNSIASNALTAQKAQQYSSRAANFTNAANQATINKSVVADPDLAPEAQNILRYYQTPVTAPIPNLKAIAGSHWTLAHDHQGVANGLDLKASQLRAEYNGATTDAVRALTNAANINRQAAQAHFTAGNAADENSYSTSKVEGGWKPAANASFGRNRVLSENAAAMSEQADRAKNEVLGDVQKSWGGWGSEKTSGRFRDADPTARHMQNMADAHKYAASMWERASSAYHSGDLGTAKAMYSQASEASARARDLADQRSLL